MNIQFMTKEKNGVPTGKIDWRGEEVFKFVPDFEEMIKNASCEEEAKAIRDTQEWLNKGIFDGFTFEIVFMAYARDIDFETGASTMKWQMMQHPWYRSEFGVYETKERMMDDIARVIEEA